MAEAYASSSDDQSSSSGSSVSENDNNVGTPRDIYPDEASSASGNSDNEEDVESDDASSADEAADEDDISVEDNGLEDDDMRHLPLAERLKRKEERRLPNLKAKRERQRKALKVASERLQQVSKGDKDSEKINSKKKKKSKHAPTEASSRRSDFFKNLEVGIVGTGVDLGANRYKPRDPRASSLHGHLQEDQFAKNYEFVQRLREKEIEVLKKRVKAWKTTGRRGNAMRRKLGLTMRTGSLEEDKEELKRLEKEKSTWERNQVDREAKQQVKKKLKDVAAQSGKIFFPKRRDLKKMEDDAKLEQIRKRKGDGAVEKILAKRRKKNKSQSAGLLGGK